MNTPSYQIKVAAARRMTESLERITKCTRFLNDEQIWNRFNNETPSVGNLMVHLTGNIRQWIISTLTDSPDGRTRESEFDGSLDIPKEELNSSMKKVISRAIEIINGLNDESLSKTYWVQGFEESGTDIILHVVEHLSYHTGQIALHTKILTGKDLGFYAGQDLNSTRPTDQ